jgi:uncharacterized protein (TIGR01777 family)
VTPRTFVRRSRLPVSADEAYRWHARAGALERLTPPWSRAAVESRSGGIEDEGARVVLRVGPMRRRWVAEHHGAVPGREFRDRQVEGPFASWEHVHRMEPDGESACTLEDRVAYALPGGVLGDRLGGRKVRALLERMFAYRHRVTADDLAAHAACRRGRPLKVAVTGASGLVGSALVPFLTAGGHQVVRLVRRPPRAGDEVRWSPEAGTIDAGGLEGVDAVVHLAGESIAGGRWTEAKKARLRSSRIGPTRLLAEALAGLRPRPAVLVSASAIGYYGHRGEATLGEEDGPADDFLGRLSVEWEAATEPAGRAGIRVVIARLGIVLSPAGGALGTLLLPFRMGVGGAVGPGSQFMSWIALDDVLGVIHHALDRGDLSGPVNAAAPEPVTSAVFARTLARILRRPAILPVPAFALRLALGEMADAALLASTRVRPGRLLATGYRFRFPELEGALRHLLGRAS